MDLDQRFRPKMHLKWNFKSLSRHFHHHFHRKSFQNYFSNKIENNNILIQFLEPWRTILSKNTLETTSNRFLNIFAIIPIEKLIKNDFSNKIINCVIVVTKNRTFSITKQKNKSIKSIQSKISISSYISIPFLATLYLYVYRKAEISDNNTLLYKYYSGKIIIKEVSDSRQSNNGIVIITGKICLLLLAHFLFFSNFFLLFSYNPTSEK